MSSESGNSTVLCPDVIATPEITVPPTATYWLNRERADAERFRPEHAQVACCMTVYNEPAAAILSSIAAIGRNVAHLRATKRFLGPSDLALCIIVDGIMALSASARALLRELRLYPTDVALGDDLAVCERAISLAQILDAVDVRSVGDEEDDHWLSIYREATSVDSRVLAAAEPAADEIGVRVLVAYKPRNRGKLDSHWWFFDRLCPALEPVYCLQMDAGTAPRADAVAELLRALDANPRIGAAASRIMINSAVRRGGFLHSWQYADFVAQKLIEWPAEVLCGYLTVIPGQFCAFRWAALVGHSRQNRAEDTVGDAPLERYFRGLRSLGPFEANMFLAEDRILGFEILARRNCNWALHYESKAVAVTDACTTLPELLKQRRRWTNSSLACNFWLIAKLGAYWRNSTAGFGAKLRVLGSAPWLVMNMVFQWFLPAFIALMNQNVADTATRRFPRVPAIASWAACLADGPLLLLVLLVACFVSRKVGRKISAVVHLFLGWQMALYVGSLLASDGVTWTAFGFEPLLLLVVAGIYSNGLLRKVAANLVQYLLLRPVMLAVITTYSFCNLHDCAWGTKGLDTVAESDTGSVAGRRRRQLQWFRWSILSAWLATNAAAIGMLNVLPGLGKAAHSGRLLAAVGVLVGIKLFSGSVAAIKVAVARTAA